MPEVRGPREIRRATDPCQPGDITVTPVTHGFMIRRVLSKPGEDLLWHYIATIKDHRVAVNVARWFARTGNVQAWQQRTDETYQTIPMGPRD
jgi:hypothetical protein